MEYIPKAERASLIKVVTTIRSDIGSLLYTNTPKFYVTLEEIKKGLEHLRTTPEVVKILNFIKLKDTKFAELIDLIGKVKSILIDIVDLNNSEAKGCVSFVMRELEEAKEFFIYIDREYAQCMAEFDCRELNEIKLKERIIHVTQTSVRVEDLSEEIVLRLREGFSTLFDKAKGIIMPEVIRNNIEYITDERQRTKIENCITLLELKPDPAQLSKAELYANIVTIETVITPTILKILNFIKLKDSKFVKLIDTLEKIQRVLTNILNVKQLEAKNEDHVFLPFSVEKLEELQKFLDYTQREYDQCMLEFGCRELNKMKLKERIIRLEDAISQKNLYVLETALYDFLINKLEELIDKSRSLLQSIKIEPISKHFSEEQQRRLNEFDLLLKEPNLKQLNIESLYEKLKLLDGYIYYFSEARRKIIAEGNMQCVMIPAQNIQRGRRSIVGDSSRIYKGVYVNGAVEIPVVIKEVPGDITVSREDWLREINIMMPLESNYIVRMFGVVAGAYKEEDPKFAIDDKPYTDTYSLVLEYVPNRSLAHVLYEIKEKLGIKKRLQIGIDVAKGLQFLHENKIVHRDVSADNVLITANFNAKLSDFSISRRYVSGSSLRTTRNIKGTWPYLAPEQARAADQQERPYSEHTDVFALGVLLWELIPQLIRDRMPPYLGFDAEHVVSKIASNECLPIPDCCDPRYVAIIKECWAINPVERPSAKQVVEELEEYRMAILQPQTLEQMPVAKGLSSLQQSFFADSSKRSSFVEMTELLSAGHSIPSPL